VADGVVAKGIPRRGFWNGRGMGAAWNTVGDLCGDLMHAVIPAKQNGDSSWPEKETDEVDGGTKRQSPTHVGHIASWCMQFSDDTKRVGIKLVID